jgi:hypothetical protein
MEVFLKSEELPIAVELTLKTGNFFEKIGIQIVKVSQS